MFIRAAQSEFSTHDGHKDHKRFLRAKLAGGLCLMALLAGCASAPPPIAEPPPQFSGPTDCSLRAMSLAIDTGNGQNAIYSTPNETPIFFKAGMVIDADGAPHAFHKDDRPDALDHLSNAGKFGNWWSLATDARGRPFVQGQGDPAPDFYVSKTALNDPQISDLSSTERYVNAQDVPFIALPTGPAAEKSYEAAGIKLGDLAVVYNERLQTFSYAIYADTSHANILGEASIRLADDLGLADTSPKSGSTDVRENLYVVFPGSSQGWPRGIDDIIDDAAQLLYAWGGHTRLVACAQQM